MTETVEAGTITWTRLLFTASGRFSDYGGFVLWKAEAAGVIAVGSSPEQARARLAAKLEARET